MYIYFYAYTYYNILMNQYALYLTQKFAIKMKMLGLQAYYLGEEYGIL